MKKRLKTRFALSGRLWFCGMQDQKNEFGSQEIK